MLFGCICILTYMPWHLSLSPCIDICMCVCIYILKYTSQKEANLRSIGKTALEGVQRRDDM